MSVKSKLIRNTIANYVIRFWGMILTFFLFYFIVNKVGVVDYGIYLFVMAITGYFGILNLGIGNSLIKFVAQYHTEDDKKKLNEVINTTFFIFLFIGIIGAVLLFLIGTFLLSYLADTFSALEAPNFYNKARAIIYFLAANFIFGLAFSTLRGIIAGIQRYDILAFIAFVMSLINLSVVLIVLSLGGGIVDLVFYQICTGLINFIIIAFYIQKKLPFVKIKFSFVNRSMIKVLMDLSMSVFLLSVFITIIYYTDRLVIGLLVDVALITFYVAAWKLYGLPAQVPAIALQAIIPAASELESKDNLPGLRRLFLRGTKYVLGLCFALAVPLFILSREILVWWMGSDYAPYFIVVQILIISLFFDFNNYVANQILTGMNKIKKFVKYYGIVAVMNLCLSIYFVQLGWGLTGVALGTTIPFILLEVFFLRYVFSVLDIKWGTYLKKVVARTLPFALAVGILLYGILLIRVPEVETVRWHIGLTDVGAYFAVGFTIYLLLFYYLGLEEYERKEIKYIISRIIAKAKSIFGGTA
ncbi:MAG: flippase [Methanomassiliicoccales archaeon]|nr:MAG: flippase [Methanomassiliicoccales archaeon]